MMNPKFVIFAGAHIDDYVWLRQQIDDGCTIICADSGARHAKAIDITPDLVIGDFDSIAPELLEFYKGQCDTIHDIDQNKTDLMKAIAKTTPHSLIEIYGAIGERADHDFSNYLILKEMDYPDNIFFKSKNETRRVIKFSCTLDGHIGDKIGIFPLSKISNLNFTGLKYPADGLPHPHEFGWNGACNEMIHNSATISFDNGIILITHTQKGD